ncbi:peptidoglycan DD-metalloendopeptidase family protein [Nocardia brasiliensis]|uniref:peptidoglycan DD-metalloendopeptidase family protein n=1 Tax=Nocardia brasiliensis TaxID=37326 RepID=UPI00366FF39F
MEINKRRSGRRRLARGIILALSIAMAMFLSLTTAQVTAAPPGLDEAVTATLLEQKKADRARTPAPVIDHMREQGDWAFGAATIPVGNADEAPISSLYVAVRSGDKWKVGLEGTAEFRNLVQQAPESVVSSGEKKTFTAPQTRELNTGLALPWRQGDSWYMGGGPHGYSGNSRPFNSLDFNGGDGRVLAPGAGRVYKTCVRANSAEVKLVHNNGYTTTYYHMTNLINAQDGTEIAAGTYLGRIGTQLPCGGSASGAHVHMSLYNTNGGAVAVNGKTFGGWTFWEGSRAYAGYAERNGVRVNVGGRLTNYGSDSSPATGTVRSHPEANSTVNLRSGPGLKHSIVGTVRDGDTVKIACTARGDTVAGKWGDTDLWNKLDTGNWISDGFVDTGSNDPVAPACTEAQVTASATPTDNAAGANAAPGTVG